MAFLYILFSPKRNRFYIGSTSDFERRFLEHNRGQTVSTKSGIPWVVAFILEVPHSQIAHRLELQLKKMKSRILLEDVICGNVELSW